MTIRLGVVLFAGPSTADYDHLVLVLRALKIMRDPRFSLGVLVFGTPPAAALRRELGPVDAGTDGVVLGGRLLPAGEPYAAVVCLPSSSLPASCAFFSWALHQLGRDTTGPQSHLPLAVVVPSSAPDTDPACRGVAALLLNYAAWIHLVAQHPASVLPWVVLLALTGRLPQRRVAPPCPDELLGSAAAGGYPPWNERQVLRQRVGAWLRGMYPPPPDVPHTGNGSAQPPKQ